MVDVWHSPDKKGSKPATKPCAAGVNNDPNSLIFIDRTKDGELTRRLRKIETDLQRTLGDKIKIVEKAGDPLKNMLWKADPWDGSDCWDPGCKVCLEELESKMLCILELARCAKRRERRVCI